jgi:hyaluronan synthase
MILFLLILMMFLSIFVMCRLTGYFRFFTKHIKDSWYDIPRDWNYKPVVTIMIPAYNEGQVLCDTFDSIMNSDYPSEKIEIISVDDGSQDDTWEWIQHMKEKFPNNLVIWKNEVNKGKPMTLVDIIRRARGEILFTIDSDSIINPNSIKEIVSCYADPNIGGVGGFPLCRNINDSLWTSVQGMLFANYFWIIKVMENFIGVSRVLCGQLASFRKEIFLECATLLENRKIMGLGGIRCGEDAFLTTQVCTGNGLSKSWKVYNNFDAIVWTNQPATMMGYLKQQLRWWRSQTVAWAVLGNLRQNIKNAGVMGIILTIATPVIRFAALITLICTWYAGSLLQYLFLFAFFGALLGMVLCLIYNRKIGRHNSISGEIKHPYITGIWFGVLLVIVTISLNVVAFFTLDDGGWITRTGGQSNISQK